MRYQTSAIGETTVLVGFLPSGGTVTVALYDLSDGSTVALTSNACAEIGTTGVYRWATTNITTQATSKTDYVYQMTDGTETTPPVKWVVGGVMDQVDLIKTEADKIALADAGAGVAGSVIEEVENRAIPGDLMGLANDAITAAKITTDAIGALELASDAVQEIVDGIRQQILTEGYAADGAAPTLEQMLFMIWSALSQFSIAGTTITAKKIDGTTASMTFSLDDGTNPKSRTRAT